MNESEPPAEGEGGPGNPSPRLPEGFDARAMLEAVHSSFGMAAWASSGGASFWEPPPAEDLTLLMPEDYVVERLIGRGGMGAVYAAHNLALDRAVALKVLPPGLGEHEEMVERFRREGWALGQLNHPNIAQIYEMGTTLDGHPFLAMELIEGEDLAKILLRHRESGTRLPETEVLRLMAQVCAAVGAAHEQGIVHRDLKPANILVTGSGVVKLVDFGLARPVDEALFGMTGAGQWLGTADYMAPEQKRRAESGRADEAPPDHRVDVYALGVMLYEMLCGDLPRGAFLAPSERAGVDPRFDALVTRALHADPACRPASVPALAGELAALERPESRWRRWRRPLALAAGLVLLGMGGTAAWQAGSGARPPSPPAGPPVPLVPPERVTSVAGRLSPIPGMPHLLAGAARVTRGEFAHFLAATGYTPSGCRPEKQDRDPLSPILTWDQPGFPQSDADPVVCVGWNDAEAYCRWLTDTALARGELAPGEQFRLPTVQERGQLGERPGGPALQDWTADPDDFHRLWHLVERGDRLGKAGQRLPTERRAGFEDRGQPDIGVWVILDAPQGGDLELSAALAKAVRAVEGEGCPLSRCGSWLRKGGVARVDLTRTLHARSLEPLAGLPVTELLTVNAEPLDLSPLAGAPLRRLFVTGGVRSLEPLRGAPLVYLNLDGVDRWPAPSLAPLAGSPLAEFAYRRHPAPPDVKLTVFPQLRRFVCIGNRLGTLDFVDGKSLEAVDIDRTDIIDPSALAPLRAARRVEYWSGLLSPVDEAMDRGDLDAALERLKAVDDALAQWRWGSGRDWGREINSKRTLLTFCKALAPADWWQSGAIGPPPAALEWRGHRYLLVRALMPLSSAEALSARWGGHLVTLTSAEENDFVINQVVSGMRSGDRAWTAALHPEAGRGWFWPTGEAFAWSPESWMQREDRHALALTRGASPWLPCDVDSRANPVIEWDPPEAPVPAQDLAARVRGRWLLPPNDEVAEFLPRGALAGRTSAQGWWTVCDAERRKIRVCTDYGRMVNVLELLADGTWLCHTPPGERVPLKPAP